MKNPIQRKIITDPNIQLNQISNDEFEKYEIKIKTITNKLERLS